MAEPAERDTPELRERTPPPRRRNGRPEAITGRVAGDVPGGRRGLLPDSRQADRQHAGGRGLSLPPRPPDGFRAGAPARTTRRCPAGTRASSWARRSGRTSRTSRSSRPGWRAARAEAVRVHGGRDPVGGARRGVHVRLRARRSASAPSPRRRPGGRSPARGSTPARVMQGVLPLLEGYPTLPLLLWLIELNLPRAGHASATADTPRPRWRRVAALGGLAIASTCTALAGHPQLPLYAFVTAGLYLLWRGWRHRRARFGAATAMALGVACAAFALWPMLLLIGRSTRVLPLAREPERHRVPLRTPRRDAPPLEGRLARAATPGHRQGLHRHRPQRFFETVTYVSWLPLLAALALVVRGDRLAKTPRPGGRVPDGRRRAGDGDRVARISRQHRRGLAHARPRPGAAGVRDHVRAGHGTRDGRQSDPGVRRPPRRAARTCREHDRPRGPRRPSPCCWRRHAIDLTLHARSFIRTGYLPADRPTPLQGQIRALVGDGRAGIDMNLSAPFNRRIDDVGFFESVILARPYVTLLDLQGTRATSTRKASTARSSTAPPSRRPAPASS